MVLRTCQRGGKVIIPAFSVGRTQELVYFLNMMISQGDLPGLPVFRGQPAGGECHGCVQPAPRAVRQRDAPVRPRDGATRRLDFHGLNYIRSVEESKAINEMHGPMVIISASGMAESGRILHHLKNNIENPRNTVMIVSWQAPDTLGRRLAERQPRVKIFGESFALRAEVATIGGLSAHAGQDMLLKYALNSDGLAAQDLPGARRRKGDRRAAGKDGRGSIEPGLLPDRGQVFEV